MTAPRPVTGLQPLQPALRSINLQPQATAEQRLGDPADPRHGQPLVEPLAATGYPWEVLAGVVGPKGPFGNEAELVGDADGWPTPAGNTSQDPTADLTPDTHAAPWPRGIEQSTDPDASARRLQQSMAIHASNTGGARRAQLRIPALNDVWQTIDTVATGSTIQDPGVPGQLKSSAGGYGTTDRVSSFARQNEYGYDAHHHHRRWAAGSIPGNYMWLRPGGRPMVKSQPGPARPPVGEMSPFTGQDITASYGVQGAVLQSDPVQYEAPPEPYVAPSYGPSADPAPVSWW